MKNSNKVFVCLFVFFELLFFLYNCFEKSYKFQFLKSSWLRWKAKSIFISGLLVLWTGTNLLYPGNRTEFYFINHLYEEDVLIPKKISYACSLLLLNTETWVMWNQQTGIYRKVVEKVIWDLKYIPIAVVKNCQLL